MDGTAKSEEQPVTPGPARVRAVPDFAAERDDGLVLFMAMQDEDREFAELACAELYRRHQQFLLAFCMQRRWETETSPSDELVDLTFLKAWNSAHSFKCRNGLDWEQSRRKVRNWLLKILNRTFIDAYRQDGHLEMISFAEILPGDDPDEEKLPANLIQCATDGCVSVSPRRKNLVLKFMEQADPRTRTLLTTIGEYWSPISRKSEIPQEVQDSLCHELGLLKNSLRVYCHRALEALENYIRKNEQNNHENTTEPR